MSDPINAAAVAAIRGRMPTVKEMQAHAEETIRRVFARQGRPADDAVIRAQARKMVRAIRPRVREMWRG